MKLTKACARFLRKHGGTILAVAASVGVVATAIETGRATTKAKHLLAVDEALRTYNEDEQGIVEEPPTKKEIVQTCWKAYVPAVILGGGTIACILGSNALNKKQIASLTAGYMALGKAYQEYRQKVIENFGIEKEAEIHKATIEESRNPVSKDGDAIRLFYEPWTKRYFHATMADVIQASYYFNRRLATDGYISVNEWCDYICSDELPRRADGDLWGWCIDQLTENYDAYWMDFEYDVQTTDDGLECYYLAPYFDPVKDYLEYDPKNHPFC